MIFEQLKSPDIQTQKLFQPLRNNFPNNKKSAVKQLKWLIKDCVAFYKVFDNYEFIGCLFLDLIDDQNKILEFGGFAKRHVNTRQAIKEFVAYLKHHYPDYTIKAKTQNLTAKISLTRAGLTKKKEGYIYE